MQISDENSIQDLDRELCVTCINDNSDKVKKPIKNYFDLFINTSLNHMSIRSCLVSQSNNNKSISNNIKLYSKKSNSMNNYLILQNNHLLPLV